MNNPRIDASHRVASSGFCLTVKRNCSISPAACIRLLVLTALLSFGIGAGFAWFGAWMILPFAGIEMVVLAAAFHAVGRHAGDYERIALEGGALVVQVHEAGRTKEHSFNPAWAKLVVEQQQAGNGVRVAIRSHGRELEIGRHLDSERRCALADELKCRLMSY